MERVFNFYPGPATLPVEVLEKARDEMLNYKGSGMSIMELSHRSRLFSELMEETEKLFIDIMEIPEGYSVLFLQGGASTQFLMVPMNLMSGNKKADYIVTGSWSEKAVKEAKLFGEVRIVASSKDKNYSYVPFVGSEKFDSNADYVHITTNNTIYGTRFFYTPDTSNIPLVADMSSNIMSEKIEVEKFGLIYAGAQKNLGPAGVTVVIIRNDLIEKAKNEIPTMLKYKTHAEKHSLFNTPPCFNIYICNLVLKWVKNIGGLAEIERRNKEKAKILYDFLDQSEFFIPTAEKESRSLMNVTFLLRDEKLNEVFIEEAEKEGLIGLKGHRSVGGMRASLYNAMSVEGVKKLVSFMKDFEARYG